MGIFRKREERAITDPLLQAILNNTSISRQDAMSIPAVSSAVDFLAGAVACMPVKLYRRSADGHVEEVTGDPRTGFLNGDTRDTLDAFQMKKAMVEDYLLDGSGYTYIRKRGNQVTGLFYVPDEKVNVQPGFSVVYKYNRISVGGAQYHAYEFIKLLRSTRNGAEGEGIVSEVYDALKTAYQTMAYQLQLVSGGGNKRGFLKSNRKIGQDEIDALKKAWSNLYSNNTESVVVLNQGLEFQEASNSSVEMQLAENVKTLADQIAGIFHISGNFEDTFKKAILPIVKAYETAINRELLLEKEKEELFFAFDTAELMRVTLKERYEAYKIAKEASIMTVNEIRRKENLNDIPGMDVLDLGLSAVLYDAKTQTYYTPNTGEVTKNGNTAKS